MAENHRLLVDTSGPRPDRLSLPTTSPRAKEVLPTLKEMTAFLLGGHMGVHLGQLSSWRRMIGLPPLF